MKFFRFFPLISILSLSICYGTEVALILHGRIVQDNSSLAPLAGIRFGAASMHFASVFGSDTTDSNGSFFVPVRISSGTQLKKDDTLHLSFNGFNKNLPVAGIGNPMRITNNSKEITFANKGILKGDTIRIEAGKNGSFPTFDGAFGYSNPYTSDYADQKILPTWVSMDECTGWVCIRITAPAAAGITECKLVKNLGNDLVYTFNFFINIQHSVPVVHRLKTASDINQFSDIVFAINSDKIATEIYLPEPKVVCAGIYSVNGKEIAPFKTAFLNRGYNNLRLDKPGVPGVYIFKLSSGKTEFSRSFYIQE